LVRYEDDQLHISLSLIFSIGVQDCGFIWLRPSEVLDKTFQTRDPSNNL
jgi:hypothetical protein